MRHVTEGSTSIPKQCVTFRTEYWIRHGVFDLELNNVLILQNWVVRHLFLRHLPDVPGRSDIFKKLLPALCEWPTFWISGPGVMLIQQIAESPHLPRLLRVFSPWEEQSCTTCEHTSTQMSSSRHEHTMLNIFHLGGYVRLNKSHAPQFPILDTSNSWLCVLFYRRRMFS